MAVSRVVIPSGLAGGSPGTQIFIKNYACVTHVSYHTRVVESLERIPSGLAGSSPASRIFISGSRSDLPSLPSEDSEICLETVQFNSQKIKKIFALN